MIFGHKLLNTPSRKLKRSPKKGHKERCERINTERIKEIISSRNKLLQQKQITETIKMITEHIIDKQKGSRENKTCKIADSIKRNVNNGSKLWEVKRRVARKNTDKRQIKDSKRNILHDSEEINKIKNIINNF